MESNIFYKPDLKLPFYPFINEYIKYDYSKINSLDDMMDFIHKGLDIIETTKNDVRRQAYIKVIYPLISIMTGISYQSCLSVTDD